MRAPGLLLYTLYFILYDKVYALYIDICALHVPPDCCYLRLLASDVPAPGAPISISISYLLSASASSIIEAFAIAHVIYMPPPP
jgi:hypothetical protein